MKTTHSQTIIAWFRRIYTFQQCLVLPYVCPRAFLAHSKHTSTKSFPHCKSFIPHMVPSYLASLAPFSSMVILCNLLALQGSDHFHSTSLTSDNFPIIVDSGCTIAASGDLDDFEPSSYTTAQNVTLRGISAGLEVASIG